MASGDTLRTFGAVDGIPPASNYAAQGGRNIHPTLEFDAATEQAIYFEDILPRNYAGNGLTITLWWMAASATSGDVKWGGSIERHQAGTTDLDSDSFGPEQTTVTTTNGTSGVESTTTLTFTAGTNMNGLLAGEAFRLKIARKAADGADTMTGNAQLTNVEIKET